MAASRRISSATVFSGLAPHALHSKYGLTRSKLSQKTPWRDAPGMDDEIEPGRERSAGQLVDARSDQAGLRWHVQPFSNRVRPGAVYLEQVRFKTDRAEDRFDVIG